MVSEADKGALAWPVRQFACPICRVRKFPTVEERRFGSRSRMPAGARANSMSPTLRPKSLADGWLHVEAASQKPPSPFRLSGLGCEGKVRPARLSSRCSRRTLPTRANLEQRRREMWSSRSTRTPTQCGDGPATLRRHSAPPRASRPPGRRAMPSQPYPALSWSRSTTVACQHGVFRACPPVIVGLWT